MCINTGADKLDDRDAKKTNSSLHKASGLLATGYKICPHKRGTYLSKERIQDGGKAKEFEGTCVDRNRTEISCSRISGRENSICCSTGYTCFKEVLKQ